MGNECFRKKFNKIFPFPYVYSDGWLAKDVKGKDGKNEIIKIANFVPYISEQIIVDDGVDKERIFTLSGVDINGKRFPDISLTAEDINNRLRSVLMKKWGAEHSIKRKAGYTEEVIGLLQYTAKFSKVLRKFNFIGWTKIDGDWTYVMPNTGFSVEMVGRCKSYKFGNREKKESINAYKDLLDSNMVNDRVKYTLISYIFLSPLNKFYRIAGIEPKFIMAIIGRTGSKKTTLAALCMSFFGGFNNTNLTFNTKDTSNFIIQQAAQIDSALVCIDDFHPAEKAQKIKMMEMLGIILRGFGDRISRNRLKSDSTLLPSKAPASNALITAETKLDINESSAARTLNIYLDKNSVNTDELTKMQDLAEEELFSSCTEHYIDYIKNNKLREKANYDHFIIKLKKDFQRERRRGTLENEGAHPRLVEDYAWLLNAFNYAMEWLVNEGWADQGYANTHINRCKAALKEVLQNHIIEVSQRKPSVIFIEVIAELLESGEYVMLEIGRDYQNKQPDNYIGYKDSQKYYFIGKKVYEAVSDYCIKTNERFTVSYKKILADLDQDNYIAEKNKGEYIKTKYVEPKLQKRTLVIKKDTIDKAL